MLFAPQNTIDNYVDEILDIVEDYGHRPILLNEQIRKEIIKIILNSVHDKNIQEEAFKEL